MMLRFGIAIGLLGIVGLSLAADDVPLGSAGYAPSPERPFGWRGDGSGRFSDATPPTTWSDTKGIRWNATVGDGYASPILTDKCVLIASEPNRLLCLDRADGKLRWQVEIKPAELADEKSRKAAAEYEPPKDGSGMMAATPLTDGKAVYVPLANGIVVAVGLDGKLKWTTYIDAEQNTGYGRSSSPLLVAGKLIVHMTNLYAFDPATGKQLWVNSDAQSKYGTPTTYKAGQEHILVTPAGDAVRVSDGKMLASDIGTAGHTSPVANGDVIFYGEGNAAAMRLDSKWKPVEVWSCTIGEETFGTPVLHNGILFTATAKGGLFAFDAAGKGEVKPLIESRLLFGEPEGKGPLVYASVTLAGKYLFLNTNRGDVAVLEATREAKVVAINRLTAGSGASPVFSGKEMYLRSGNKLLCIGE